MFALTLVKRDLNQNTSKQRKSGLFLSTSDRYPKSLSLDLGNKSQAVLKSCENRIQNELSTLLFIFKSHIYILFRRCKDGLQRDGLLYKLIIHKVNTRGHLVVLPCWWLSSGGEQSLFLREGAILTQGVCRPSAILVYIKSLLCSPPLIFP